MSGRSDDNGVLIVMLGGGAIVAAIIWQFSTFFGLDMKTGARVFGLLVSWAVVAGACWKFGQDFEPVALENSWPVLLGLFLACWWPAVDFWAVKDVPAFRVADEATLWWDAWYTKAGASAAAIGLGYLVKNMLDD